MMNALPTVVSEYAEDSRLHGLFQRAYSLDEHTLLRRIAERFVRQPDTDIGMGAHYIVHLMGSAYTGGTRAVQMVTRHHNIPLLDLSLLTEHHLNQFTIRDLLKYLLDTTPPRCAILVDLTRDGGGILRKVMKRLATTQMDIRYRRVFFCLVAESGFPSDVSATMFFPGSAADKSGMVLYRLPPNLTCLDGIETTGLLPLVQKMKDYTLFEPTIWQHVQTEGTLDVFLSTSLYQVARRDMFENDTTIQDDFPAFEVPWRRSMSRVLQDSLDPPPEMTCNSLHRVIPIGVSSDDALRSIQAAMPTTKDPYSLTLVTEAVDDVCGSFAVSQPLRNTVVHITCVVDPAALVKVGQELRTGYRAVVNELVSSKKIINELMSRTKDMQENMSQMKEDLSRLLKRDDAHHQVQPLIEAEKRLVCRKKRCKRLTSGTSRQCDQCLSSANMSRTKRRKLGVSPKDET
jgi:hypothetical protein